ncbi:MAG: 5-formyltetrahydrofolate cyclo-ligase [Alphaproteobacteria bacterium]
MTKDDLREHLHALRGNFAAKQGACASALLNELLISANIIPNDAIIAGYYPTKDEVDPRPTIHHYLEQGHRCCLPYTCFGTRILQFREFSAVSILAPDAQQIMSPLAGAELIPSVLLIPMLGFDRKGYRLGQGGGHYDSTIDYFLHNDHHPLTVGLAFDCQEVEALPLEIHDYPMDYIVTQTRILNF